MPRYTRCKANEQLRMYIEDKLKLGWSPEIISHRLKREILLRYFLYDRKLLGKLSQCAAKSLNKFFQLTLGKKTGIPGIVLAIQAFGDYAKFHPHLHALVTDSLFLESGYFYVMPKVDLHPLREIFRAHVLKMLKKEELIDEIFI